MMFDMFGMLPFYYRLCVLLAAASLFEVSYETWESLMTPCFQLSHMKAFIHKKPTAKTVSSNHCQELVHCGESRWLNMGVAPSTVQVV